MMLPEHLRPIAALRARGVPITMLLQGQPLRRRPSGRSLLYLGDDAEGGSVGPIGFDSPQLQAWLGGTRRALIGIFAGDPVASAYATVADASATHPDGAVLIECTVGTWLEWSRYVDRLAPTAARLSVHPEAPKSGFLRLEPVGALTAAMPWTAGQ